MKKTPAVVRAKVGSRKMVKSGSTLEPFMGGRRERMRRLATMRRTTKIRPMTRVAQAKPMRGKRACSMMGKMMPPMEPPVAANPVALPRFSRKKWPMAEMAGVKIREVPIPPRTPKTRMKCQYAGSAGSDLHVTLVN